MLLSGGSAGAAGGAGWTQFQGDAAHSGSAEGPAPPFREAWSFPVPPKEGQGVSAPVIGQRAGIAITVAPEEVVAVDLESGSEAWSIPRALGPSAPPAIAEAGGEIALLYTEGKGDENTALTAVDLDERKELWESPVAMEAASRTGVTVSDGTAFVGDQRGNVTAVDVASGEQRWIREAGGPLEAPLTVAGDRLIVVTSPDERSAPEVLALSVGTGEREWTAEPSAFAVGAASVPVADGERVYIGFPDGSVQAFDLDDGAAAWTSRRFYSAFSPWMTGATVPDGVLLSDISGDVRRLGAGDGATAWDFALNEIVVRSSPIVSGTTAVVGFADGGMGALDVARGRLIWRRGGGGSGLIGAFAVTRELLVAVRGGEEGGLVGYEHDPDGALIDLRSPSEPVAGALLGWFALAAVAVIGVLFVPLRLAAARLGPVALPKEDPEGAEPGIDAEPDEELER